MSHNIDYYDYPENVDQKKVQADLDNYVAHVDWQEGASGLPRSIRWMSNFVYDDEDEARAAIEKEDERTWYNCMAVKYRKYPKPRNSKALMEMAERSKKARESYEKIVSESDIQRRTSAYIGCPKCGSQLKRELISGQRCPLCREDLRSKTNLDRMKRADEKVKELSKKYEDTVREWSKKGKPEVRWLVKIEYHT